MKILPYSKVDSTNTIALELAAAGAETETVVWALSQSSGRGQYGREFASPEGGLYFSVILQSDLPPERLPLVTLAAGVGCCLGLEHHLTVYPLLKWPNDLYLQGKKVGGILTESLPLFRDNSTKVVIGIGLNVNSKRSDFTAENVHSVITLSETTHSTIDLRELLQVLVRQILLQVRLLERNQDKLLAQWNTRDYLKGRSVEWNNGRSIIVGWGQGILQDGRYGILDNDGFLHPVLAGTLKPSARLKESL